MIFPVVFTALGVLTAGYFITLRVRKSTVKAVIIKSLASSFFVASAVSSLVKKAGGPNALYCALIVGGLFFDLLGDIWLDFKMVYREDEVQYTYAGFIAFGIGHLFYNSAMLYKYYIPGNYLLLLMPVIGCIIGVGTIMLCEKKFQLKYGRYKAVTLIYSALLVSFVMISFCLAVLHKLKEPTLVMTNVGALLMLISDMVLNEIYFGVEKNSPLNIGINHGLYYIAQFVIAFSLCFVK